MTTRPSEESPFQNFGPGLHYVDVRYQGQPHMIAVGVIETEAGLLLVDPGPSVSLPGLRQGLAANGWSLRDVTGILLTHIHLDHAGATGTIVQEQPSVQVWVHERGARHMVNPERLLRSARRLYGEQMNVLWGTVSPVPEDHVVAVKGGMKLAVGGRELDVHYTPGHAVHHVTYLDSETRTAFIGDVGGQRTTGLPFVLPVTPPPDVNLERWQESLDLLQAQQPEQLFLTHFGPSSDVSRHLGRMRAELKAWGKQVLGMLDDERDDAARAAAFAKEKKRAIRSQVPEEERRPYLEFGHPAGSWHGLARYWRTRRDAIAE